MPSGIVRVARRGLSCGLPLVLFFGVYFAAAKVGLSFDPVSGVASSVWPPTGIALAALIRVGGWLWPAITLGAFLTNHQAGMPVLAALIMAAGNTLEAVAGMWLLRRYHFRPALDRLRDVVLLVVAAGLVSTTISATGGALGLWVADAAVPDGLAAVWSTWWLGDVMGDLLVATLLLTWSARDAHPALPRRRAEALVLTALLVATTLLVLGGLLPAPISQLLRQSHVIFPLLVWAAVRFGPRGASAAAVTLAAIAITCTVLGRGPFAHGSEHEALLFLQTYLMVEVVTALTIAAVLMERRAAVAARDEFISVASHELNTPIAALKLRLGLMARVLDQQEMPGSSRQDLVERLRRADRQVDRLTRLVADMLDVSRLTAGRLTLNPGPLDLSDVVRDVVERLREELSAAGCQAELRLEPGISGRWDRSRLEQALTNLLTNVVKYAPGAPVEVSARRVDGVVRLAVRDRGPGIPADQQRRIFDPYERGAADRGVGGLGLGLFIVREIVRAHGGELTLESAPGNGATFNIQLPTSPVRDAPVA